MTKVFIDGSSGTTGLRIYERLEARQDVTLLRLDDAVRKDPAARREALNSCDAAFLCLPDDAAREAVSMVTDPDVVIFDTSTAHRTALGWAYGFPELSAAHLAAVKTSKRVAVPGCHASGFVALVKPLIDAGAITPSTPLVCHSLTGYSGGGKRMIAEYEADELDPLYLGPRQYGVAQKHKHLPEMTVVTGLTVPPVFCPIVANYYSGMEVTVALFKEYLTGGFTTERIKELYRSTYTGGLVSDVEDDENGYLSAAAMAGKDTMHLTVLGNEDRILLVSRFDNLGKGASGAAIQCMNLALGFDETSGLVV